MRTRDGVRLDADVYRPDAAGPFPVLLMRQPYGREIASTVVYAHPTWYAAQGYIVVIQDVRGRGTSAGKFELFANEVADGEDTVNWAAQLPGSDGQVGMYGFSYQGMTQLYAAQAQPAALKAIAPAMVGYHPYADWAYENGALCFQIGLSWAIQLAAETARLAGDEARYQQLYAAARQLPLNDPVPARPEVLAAIAPESFFHDWLDHPTEDDYWQSLTPQLDSVDLPMLHIGGWFDPYLRGNLRLYREMASRSPQPQQLWVGPWGHIPWGRKVGAVDFGSKAISPMDQVQIRWFEHFLKGKLTDLLDQPPVCWFEMGSNHWRRFDAWPQPETQRYFLHSSGLASIRTDDGKLSQAPLSDGDDVLIHDPWRPGPARGGHAAIPAGSFERTEIDSRSDVLTYTTGPLKASLEVAGEPAVELICQTDAASYDLCAVLSVVHPDGTVYNLTQGYRRCDRDAIQPISLTLQPTCFRLNLGQALRLSLSAACFPAYPVNPGTGNPAKSARLIEAQIITLTIQHGQSAGSKVLLPVLPSAAIG